jgi:hypothetical protein
MYQHGKYPVTLFMIDRMSLKCESISLAEMKIANHECMAKTYLNIHAK